MIHIFVGDDSIKLAHMIFFFFWTMGVDFQGVDLLHWDKFLAELIFILHIRQKCPCISMLFCKELASVPAILGQV